MQKIKVSMEQGSLFKVLLGVAMTSLFIIFALLDLSEAKRYYFWIFIGVILTWQQYSRYLIKKQNTPS